MTLRNKELPVPSARLLRGLIIGVTLLLIAGALWLVWVMSQVQKENTKQDAQIAEARYDTAVLRAVNEVQDAELLATREAIREANRKLRKQGLPPVDVPPVAEPIPGETGATGPPGPSGPRGLRGFRGLPGESIVGPAGPAGEDGESIVGPAGPPGSDGKDGKDGEDSTVPGPTGPSGPAGEDGVSAVPFMFLFTIPADETLPDLSPAQTYQCVIPTPGGPFTCELVAA